MGLLQMVLEPEAGVVEKKVLVLQRRNVKQIGNNVLQRVNRARSPRVAKREVVLEKRKVEVKANRLKREVQRTQIRPLMMVSVLNKRAKLCPKPSFLPQMMTRRKRVVNFELLAGKIYASNDHKMIFFLIDIISPFAEMKAVAKEAEPAGAEELLPVQRKASVGVQYRVHRLSHDPHPQVPVLVPVLLVLVPVLVLLDLLVLVRLVDQTRGLNLVQSLDPNHVHVQNRAQNPTPDPSLDPGLDPSLVPNPDPSLVRSVRPVVLLGLHAHQSRQEILQGLGRSLDLVQKHRNLAQIRIKG